MGPKTYRGPTGTQKLFNKRKRSRHRLCVFAPGSSFWSEFRLFPFSWVYFKNTGWGAKKKNRLSHSEGCKRGATERPPQRESKGLITGEVKRCSAPLHLLLLLLSSLFRRTRWTPGPGRSRNGTVPVDKDTHMNRQQSVESGTVFIPPCDTGSPHSPECPPCWVCCSSGSSQHGRHRPRSVSWPSHTQCCWHRTPRCVHLHSCWKHTQIQTHECKCTCSDIQKLSYSYSSQLVLDKCLLFREKVQI